MDVCLLLSVVCQVEDSASGWSLIQRSPTDCGVCNWVWLWIIDNEALALWGLSDHSEIKECRRQKDVWRSFLDLLQSNKVPMYGRTTKNQNEIIRTVDAFWKLKGIILQCESYVFARQRLSTALSYSLSLTHLTDTNTYCDYVSARARNLDGFWNRRASVVYLTKWSMRKWIQNVRARHRTGLLAIYDVREYGCRIEFRWLGCC